MTIFDKNQQQPIKLNKKNYIWRVCWLHVSYNACIRTDGHKLKIRKRSTTAFQKSMTSLQRWDKYKQYITISLTSMTWKWHKTQLRRTPGSSPYPNVLAISSKSCS